MFTIFEALFCRNGRQKFICKRIVNEDTSVVMDRIIERMQGRGWCLLSCKVELHGGKHENRYSKVDARDRR